jgi:UDP-glucose 4-epimerase
VKKENTSSYAIYNLGSGNGVSVLEAIKAFESVAKVKLNYEISPRRAGDVVAIYSNSAKAMKELKWKPQYNIDDMMSSAWKWQLYLNSLSKE